MSPRTNDNATPDAERATPAEVTPEAAITEVAAEVSPAEATSDVAPAGATPEAASSEAASSDGPSGEDSADGAASAWPPCVGCRSRSGAGGRLNSVSARPRWPSP